MSEVLIPAAEEAVVADAFNPRAAFFSVVSSIVVNGVLPFALYKYLVPHFSSGSVMPLLYASAFPIVGLTINFFRTRVIDTIAILALFGIAYSVTTTLLAGQIRLAMILGSTQGFVIAAAFAASAFIGRPIFYFMVRQFVAGNDASRRERFAAVNQADGGRTFYIATMVWAAGIAFLGSVALALAMILPPATYLLVNNIVNTAVNILLLIWTIRFVRTRLTRASELLAAI